MVGGEGKDGAEDYPDDYADYASPEDKAEELALVHELLGRRGNHN
jgi:hypothetical protein